jgi:monooxygenase
MRKARNPIAPLAQQREPFHDGPTVTAEPWTSSYIQRAAAIFPKQASKKPWKLYQNYALDPIALKHGAIEEGVMHFANPRSSASPREADGAVLASG